MASKNAETAENSSPADLVVPPEDSAANGLLQDVKLKRSSRCPGCKTGHEEHHWGQPGPHCQGKPEDTTSFQLLSPGHVPPQAPGTSHSSIDVGKVATSSVVIDKAALLQRLDALALEEKELTELAALRATVLEKEAAIAQQRQLLSTKALSMATGAVPQQQQPVASDLGLFTLPDLRQPTQQTAQPSQTSFGAHHLDNLLGLPPSTTEVYQQPPGFAWQEQLRGSQLNNNMVSSKSLRAQFQDNESRHADMFLAPASVPQGEKILRIVDFLSSIVPQDSEEVLSTAGHSRLVLSYGQQRPRLSSVTWQQWVIANTRIFHALLFSCKLPTIQDIRDYLAYTVKVMELAGKYEWLSVLKYDDEYRQLQATYSFPWSYDSPHLHELILVPRVKATKSPALSPAPSGTSAAPSFATYSGDGRLICRSFNMPKGCHLPSCSFAHVCSRKFQGKGCSGPHSATQHFSTGGGSK